MSEYSWDVWPRPGMSEGACNTSPDGTLTVMRSVYHDTEPDSNIPYPPGNNNCAVPYVANNGFIIMPAGTESSYSPDTGANWYTSPASKWEKHEDRFGAINPTGTKAVMISTSNNELFVWTGEWVPVLINGGSANIRSIRYCNGLFIALDHFGTTNYAYVSDGTDYEESWDQIELPSDSENPFVILDICYNGKYFLAGEKCVLFKGNDLTPATVWSPCNTGIASPNIGRFLGIKCAGNTIVACGNDNGTPIIAGSNNSGESWVITTFSGQEIHSASIQRNGSDGKWMMLQPDIKQVYGSDDGRYWTLLEANTGVRAISSGPSSVNGVIHGPGTAPLDNDYPVPNQAIVEQGERWECITVRKTSPTSSIQRMWGGELA